MRNRVITAVNLETWAVFFVRNNAADVTSFVQMYQTEAPRLGIRVAQPEMVCLENDKVDTLAQALRKAINPRVSHNLGRVCVCVCVFFFKGLPDCWAEIQLL
jgi:hypothetical protein